MNLYLAIFILSYLLLGGFYDWAVTMIGIAILGGLFYFYAKEKNAHHLSSDRLNIAFFSLPVLCIVSSFFAVDLTMHVSGLFRIATICLWFCLCSQFDAERKEMLLFSVPFIGSFTALTVLVSLISRPIYNFFWQAGRFGGFFQSPNTCALLFCISTVILVDRAGFFLNDLPVPFTASPVAQKGFYIFLLISNAGSILFTGSRTILLLLLAWGIYKACITPKMRLPLLGGMGSLLLVALSAFLITGNRQNLGRIFTIFSLPGTLLGRILYQKDAFLYLLKHPLGLGYMGYYYLQGTFQTGVYETRFVHNDILQTGLDYGLITMVVLIATWLICLVKSRHSMLQKELLVLIPLASLTDFHLQFLFMDMVLLLCIKAGTPGQKLKAVHYKENYFFLTLFCLLYLYFCVPYTVHGMHRYDMALSWLPSYTESLTYKLAVCDSSEEAQRITEEILKHNDSVFSAWHTKVYLARMEHAYDEMILAMDKALTLNPYDISIYRQYDSLITEVLQTENEKISPEELSRLLTEQDSLPERLKFLEKRTDKIAYLLRDQPVFSLK